MCILFIYEWLVFFFLSKTSLFGSVNKKNILKRGGGEEIMHGKKKKRGALYYKYRNIRSMLCMYEQKQK